MATSVTRDEQVPRTSARAPFDNPAADTILRSRDGVDFRVHSIIVAEASHVFADMFTIPQPPRSPAGADDSADYAGDGTPVVRLEEDARTLDSLLRLCYPVADPAVDGAEELRAVLAAALKYEMEEAAALMRKRLRALVFTSPLEAWAVACSVRLEEDARSAAAALCAVGIPSDEPAVLREVTAGQYFRLLKFIANEGEDPGENVGFNFTEPNPEDAGEEDREQDVFRLNLLAMQLKDRPFADVICRTSSGEELLSHRAILATASPVLEERLLALDGAKSPGAQSASAADPTSELPVLEFDDASRTLSVVLELCYPVRRSKLFGLAFPLADICALTVVAQKYSMDFVLGLLHGAFYSQSHRARLAAYLLAAQAGLAAYALDAERSLLRRGQAPFAYGWLPEMESIPALAYHQLVVKHRLVERHGYDEYAYGSSRKRRRTEVDD